MPTIETCCQILGVSPADTIDAIRAAYLKRRAEITTAHDETLAGQHLDELEEAYTYLVNALRNGEQQSSSNALALQMGTGLPALQQQTPTVSETITCPNCGFANPGNARMCVRCGAQVTRSCPNCGNKITLDQVVCNRCGCVINEYNQNRFAQGLATEQRIQEDRQTSEARTAVYNEVFEQENSQACVFWFVVGVLSLIAISAFFVVYNG